MIKIKFCGISHIEDAIVASNYADLIGVVTDPVSPRFVKPEFIDIVKNFVNKPVVNVKVKGKINDIVNESKADYVQIHRVLDMEEIEDILSYNKKFILYVPSSEKYYSYFKTIVNKTNHLILIDSEKKGEKVNLEVSKIWIKEYDKVGIGGGITLNNIEEFLSLNPYWIDISSGIEKYKSKKDHDKMIRIVEKVKEWKSIL
ncbi:phosphoribosylanthranilate isomerase [Sulfurisphaera ohwakuensis]|uniref:N-(5'-phosphoribosyl)anthranilate isomerase n=1 Tax=Sulfurisphaera ohwakuensis TaxID=69656 RepID=A0A650CGV4_SULOH|nr:phosphoribosylanthranilate isomerase [Sulfurisphaera ohwakuensis]MBB5252579.1 phosphoribosylanthranilate isomerase [Sulfurisphaera ohwakuensis]QGR16978.1 N-(5'-phosphoribosyl)anthranilate isomerase [Sulfurisphaera ohwakuensis]